MAVVWNAANPAKAQDWREARLPTMYPFRQFVDAGGLMSYGANLPDLFRRAAGHVDKKAVGLAIAPSLRMRADEIVE